MENKKVRLPRKQKKKLKKIVFRHDAFITGYYVARYMSLAERVTFGRAMNKFNRLIGR